MRWNCLKAYSSLDDWYEILGRFWRFFDFVGMEAGQHTYAYWNESGVNMQRNVEQ